MQECIFFVYLFVWLVFVVVVIVVGVVVVVVWVGHCIKTSRSLGKCLAMNPSTQCSKSFLGNRQMPGLESIPMCEKNIPYHIQGLNT